MWEVKNKNRSVSTVPLQRDCCTINYRLVIESRWDGYTILVKKYKNMRRGMFGVPGSACNPNQTGSVQ